MPQVPALDAPGPVTTSAPPDSAAGPAHRGCVSDWHLDHPAVLVVDDDPISQDVVRMMLSGDGLEVITAADAESALVAARRHTIAAVVLDVVLPGVDGHELCRRLREGPLGRGVPVIMLTGLDSVGSELDSVLSGADAHLTKPVSRDALIARLQDLL